MDRMVWEGWTVQDFIDELAPQLEIIMSGQSWKKPLTSRKELENWLKDNQPHYKKTIPKVMSYFSKKYGLK